MKKTILDRVKTWEDVCSIKGIDPVTSLPFPNLPKDREDGKFDTEEGVNAFFQLSTIREVLNDGKDADWSNSSEAKWYPWPTVVKDESKPSGFGLSDVDVYDFVCTFTATCVGSRLSFNSLEKANHAFTQFQPIYEKFMLITKTK